MLDTDTTSALQRGHPVVSEQVAAAESGTVAPTVVTLYEQFRGRLAAVNRASTSAALQVAFAQLLETLQFFCDNDVVPFDAAAAGIFRALVAQRARIGT